MKDFFCGIVGGRFAWEILGRIFVWEIDCVRDS